MTRITLHLPLPPSTNRLWRANRGKVHRSKVYLSWLQEAGLQWLTQKQSQPKSIAYSFTAQVVLVRPDKRRRDLDNHSTKALLDFCTLHQVVVDDSLCEKLYIRWGKPSEAPLGCRLILKG